jgi:hypothetical protein
VTARRCTIESSIDQAYRAPSVVAHMVVPGRVRLGSSLHRKGTDQPSLSSAFGRPNLSLNAYRGRFQLIIAENDTPPIQLPDSFEVRLSYDGPLVHGVAHPGPLIEPLATP